MCILAFFTGTYTKIRLPPPYVYLNSCLMICLYIFHQYKVGPHGLVSTSGKIKIPCVFLLIFVYVYFGFFYRDIHKN